VQWRSAIAPVSTEMRKLAEIRLVAGERPSGPGMRRASEDRILFR
jgi:hypothetical protein